MIQFNKLCAIAFSVVLFGIHGASRAQSKDELLNQFRTTCTQEFLTANPDMRDYCKSIKQTIDSLNLQSSITEASGQQTPVDGTTQCNCSRKLGQCRAIASLRSEKPKGTLAKHVLRITPPPGQCAEVTVYLSPRNNGTQSAIREPTYRVLNGPTDVAWSSGVVEYQLLSTDTECYICDHANRRDPNSLLAQETRDEIGQSYKKQYRDCLRGISAGFDLSKLDPKMRSEICEGLRREALKYP